MTHRVLPAGGSVLEVREVTQDPRIDVLQNIFDCEHQQMTTTQTRSDRRSRG